MRIAIIGCGNMGSALAERLAPFHTLLLHSRTMSTAEKLAKKVGAEALETLEEVIKEAEVIFLTIKPQQLKDCAQQMKDYLKSNQILVSLLAGTPIAILNHFFEKPTLVRMMPNLAIRYGKGVIGMVEAAHLSMKLKNELNELLAPLGFIYWLPESHMDGLTALAGSGPAFILTLIESMVEAGVAMGLPAKDSQELILHMFEGTIALLEKSGDHPGDIKWQIASPGGVTIEGIRVLEQKNVRSGVMEAFLAAYKKSKEMS